jgi:hypothetical protein
MCVEGHLVTTPFRLEATDALQAGKNELEITVVNSWQNRLIGDRGKLQEDRYTQTNIKIRDDWKLPLGSAGTRTSQVDSVNMPTGLYNVCPL